MRFTPAKLLIYLSIIGGLVYVVNTANIFSLLASVITSTTLPNDNGTLEDGLVGHWTFDGSDISSGTTAIDTSGSGNNGTLTNGPTPTMGQVGQALSFDGVDDQVSMSLIDLTATDRLTASVWIKPSSLGLKNIIEIGSTNGHAIWQNASGGFYCGSVFITSGLQTVTSNSNALQAGKWQHITCVYDGSKQILYVNGVEVKRNTISEQFANSPTGSTILSTSAARFGGSMDDPRIYNRALSADEIWQLYHQGKPDKINTAESQGDTLTQGLVGYWSLDEASGASAADASGNSNTGTLINGPTWTTGKIRGATNFDGVNDYVDAGNGTSLSFTGDITISTWINPSSLSDYKFYLSKYSGTNLGYDLGIMANGRIVATFRNGTNIDGFSNIGLIQSGIWQHVVVVQDSSTCHVRIYKDGVLDTTLTNQQCFINPSNSLNIGSRNGTGPFAGSMDEVRIYNRELSADEIVNLYKTTNPTVVDTGLVGHWSFDGDDMSGTTAYDRSGKGNNGTLTNGPTKTIGKVGQAIKFDGVNDYVNIPNSSNLNPGTGDFTISAWVKFDSAPNDFTRIISKGSGANFYAFVKFPSDRWKFEFRDGTLSTADIDFGSATISYGNWMHLVATVSAGSNLTSGYLDGVLKDTSSTAGYASVTNTDYFSVGRASTVGAPYSIDDVRVFNRTLSADEIKDLYTKGEGVHVNTSQNTIQGSTLQDGLIGLWSFDGPDVSGATAYDRSGQGNNGTLTNGPVPTIGKIGQAMKFDGVDDYVRVASLDNASFPQNGTLSFWIKGDLTSQTTKGVFDNYGVVNHIFVRTCSTNNCSGVPTQGLQVAFQDPTTYIFGRTFTVENNEWAHVVVAWDTVNDIGYVYLNKELVSPGSGSITSPSWVPDQERAYIGGLGGSHFNGDLDDVRIYNRVLSAEEIQQLYQSGQ